MSFDLHFCISGNTQVDLIEVRKYMHELDHMTKSTPDVGGFTQFQYNNPATDVYCMFDLVNPAEVEPEDYLELPDGNVSTGLSVSVNYIRPHFFAMETMPIVSGIADAFGMGLYDLQEDKLYPPKTSSQVLIHSWIMHNEWATRTLARDSEAIRKPYLAPEQSAYWWRYMRAREEFQNSLTLDVFVPSILPMVDANNNVKLTVIWSAEVRSQLSSQKRLAPLPQIFPFCDYIMLCWGKPEAHQLERVIVPYSTVMATLATLVYEIDGPVEGLKVLPPEGESTAATVFESMSEFESEGLRLISADGFVDVLIDS